MDIGGTLASAFDTCLDCANRVATSIGLRTESLIGSATRVSHAGTPAMPDLDPGRDTQAASDEVRFRVGARAAARGPAARAAAPGDGGELPSAYGYDRIVLLPRDPWSAFAYWEITPASREDAARRVGAYGDQAHDVLRVHDIRASTTGDHEAALSFDVELPAGVESWYLRLPRPGWSYYVEIGLRLPGGGFLPLARSSTIVSPRTTPSRDDTVRWVTLGNEGAGVAAAGGASQPPHVADADDTA